MRLRLLLVWLHVGQLVLLPLIAMGHLLRERTVPLSEDSAWWYVVMLSLVVAAFTPLVYGFRVGFFDAKHFAPRLFVEKKATREFLVMVVVPLLWLGWSASEGPGEYAEALRESGVLVLAGHHVVLSALLLRSVLRRLVSEPFSGWAVPVVGWRVASTLLLGAAGFFFAWAWSATHSRAEGTAFAVALAVELFGSVPFYAANLDAIFEA